MDRVLLFLAKVVALEALRRGSNAKCRPIWWGLQGISLLQTPPLKWLQRWRHVRRLTECTQSLSKPMLFLSIATSFTGALDEQRRSDQPLPDAKRADSRVQQVVRSQTSSNEIQICKRELAKEGVVLTERLNDDELERFLVASNNDHERFVQLVKKSLQWRERYYFLSPPELAGWSNLVYWHYYDKEQRPVLVVRLGPAYSMLSADDRPRFAQAVVSQVEHGIVHLVHQADPRVTVIMDCDGTPAIGFPVGMMKSCSLLVQEHYPTRLARLFVINLPPVVKVIANALIQVLKPVTRKKVQVEGDQYLDLLAELLGGPENVPAYVGGSCRCAICCAESHNNRVPRSIVAEEEGVAEEGRRGMLEDDEDSLEIRSYNSLLITLILAFLMIWTLVALMAGFHDPVTENSAGSYHQ